MMKNINTKTGTTQSGTDAINQEMSKIKKDIEFIKIAIEILVGDAGIDVLERINSTWQYKKEKECHGKRFT